MHKFSNKALICFETKEEAQKAIEDISQYQKDTAKAN